MKKLIVSAALAAVFAVAGFARANTVEAQSGGATVASFGITITNAGIAIVGPLAGPYDNADDTAIDVFNNSTSSVPSITVSSTLDIDGFDGDGISTFVAAPTGPTGYEGPGTSFTNVLGENFNGVDGLGQTAATESVTVNFAGGLAPGATAYFSLEEDLSSATLPITVTNGTPLPSSALMGLVGIAGLLAMKKFAPKMA